MGRSAERHVSAPNGGSRSLPVATPGNRVDGFQAVADLAAADG
jgi:hypothetical protein